MIEMRVTGLMWLRRTSLNFLKGIQKYEGTLTLAGVVALLVYCFLGGDFGGHGVSMAIIVAGMAGGNSINGEPATLENTESASPGLLVSAIDRQVVKIRPSSTPLDQISRWGGSRLISSMKAEYYAVDTKPFITFTTSSSMASSASSAEITVENRSIFSPTDTVYFPEVEVTRENKEKAQGFVGYVQDSRGGNLNILAVNNYDNGVPAMPNISSGTKVIRMGRGAAELDVQTEQYEALPTRDFNYCQIFKTQIEQSTLMKLSNKEVNWSLSDMEESAIVDMRLAMEKSFLFGHRAKINNEKGDSIYLTGGIWHQTDKTASYQSLTPADLVEMCRQAFTGCGGSKKKVLIGGSELVSQLNQLDHTRIVVGSQTKSYWGIDFTEIVTNFGSLCLTMSEIFDQCGMPGNGMIIDPEYLVKYSHIPFNTERLNLRQSGQRNTDAIVVTEGSCLVLRYPTAHCKIVKE